MIRVINQVFQLATAETFLTFVIDKYQALVDGEGGLDLSAIQFVIEMDTIPNIIGILKSR